MIGQTATPNLGIYVHWPYCKRICPYCDFNVYKNRNVSIDRWISAFKKDLSYWAQYSSNRTLTSLYFGGGTPSLAPLPIIETIVETCDQLWGFQPNAEITLEANPGDIEPHKIEALSKTGITRLSLGVQSFDNEALQFLGRDHTAEDAVRAITHAREYLPNLTFDLIYGRPNQSFNAWETELKQAIQFDTGHLSLYQLTIEPNTAFAKAVDRGTLLMPEADQLADFYEGALSLTHQAGFEHYEISNFAKPGKKAKHNLLYWRYQDYIGIGPGAHGRLTIDGSAPKPPQRIATETHLDPEHYLQACEENHHGTHHQEILSLEQQMQERFSLGLRLQEGIKLNKDDFFFQNTGRQTMLNDFMKEGLLTFENNQLRATLRGRKVLDHILTYLLV